VECGAVGRLRPGNETHLHAFETRLLGPDGSDQRLYLHTSPEFAAKKLLTAGEARIFDFARVFRNRERGRLHAPEFTMLEWYRAHEDYTAVITDSLALLRLAAGVVEAERFSHRQAQCDPRAQAERLTVAEAFTHFAGIDLLATLSASGEGDAGSLRSRARRGGVEVSDDDDWSDMFSKILTLRVEPRWVWNGPASFTSIRSARRRWRGSVRAIARVAERFELYVCGVELANGFGELTDPVQQRARLKTRWPRKNASMASAIRWTRISLQRWPTCRPPAVWRWASTAW
jgi:lysyl-tRNA synthetase class 2